MSEHAMATDYAPGFHRNSGEVVGIFATHGAYKTVGEYCAQAVDEYVKELGVKYDGEKLRWTLLPWSELEAVVRVLERGARKYSPDNWKHVKPIERYVNALLRHAAAYAEGEILDPESGESHMAHIVCNALFVLWHERNSGSPIREEDVPDLERRLSALEAACRHCGIKIDADED